ncbi:multi-sensor hybrid histidine kinase [Rhodopirellula maiorica SM1]|uniref:Sensory/regulatory protein RpfC n=1 Tax=Rhodopirellula maiorica SM1 TaxID=1265738 RepID=M5RKB4_9BACT|nr:PAS domain S-box protein [Rhodopirellula maiorica]EMI15792.1 multi-sensor hybrid histidine kinase [Rhodopirellula maiorica SM1]
MPILQSRSMKWYLPLLLLIAGVICTNILHQQMRSLDQNAIREGFRREAQERVAVFESEFARPIDLIRSVHSLYGSSENVDQREFLRFVDQMKPERVGFDAITWVQHVDDSQRSDYERGDYARGGSSDNEIGHRIVQRGEEGQLQPASQRQTYLPVTYKYPAGNPRVELGEDLNHNAQLRDTFAIAMVSKHVTASPALSSSDPAARFQVLLVSPVFHQNDHPSETKTWPKLKGFVVGRLRLDQVLENAIEPLAPSGIKIQLYENTAPKDTRAAYLHESRIAEHASNESEPTGVLSRELSPPLLYEGFVQQAGRTWTLHCTANADYVAVRRDATPRSTLFLGLMASVLVSAFVAYLFRKNEMVERLVVGRTADLNQAKLKVEEQLAKQEALEKELDVSREQFNVLMLGCNDGIFEWDLETNRFFFSPRFLEMLGYNREDIGDDADAALELLHPDEREKVATKLDQYVRGETEKFEVECRIRHKDDHYVHVLSRAFAVFRDGDSRPNRLVGSHVDLTEWKKHEIELDQFKTTLDQTHDSVFMLDPDTHMFYYVNQGATKLLGYSAEELCQLGPGDIDVGMSADDLQCMTVSLKSGETTMQRVETVVRRKDGRDVPVDLFVQYIAPDDEPARFVTVVRDISERKQNEAVLAERNRLAMLTADVGVALSRADVLDTGLQECCEAIVDRLHVSFVRIWTTDSSQSVLELKASAGLYTHRDGDHSQISIGEGCVGRLAERGRPFLTNELQNDPELENLQWAQTQNLVAFAGYPLIVGEQVVGVLALFSQQPLQINTLESLSSIADTVGVFVERKRAEDELQQSHELISKLSLVASKTQHAVFIMDAECRIEWVNDAFIQMSQYEAFEVVGRRPADFLIGEGTDPETVRLIRSKIENRESIATEVYNYKKSGEGHWVDLKVDPVFDESGTLCNFVTTQIDITERRKNQRALVAAKVEAERASRAKSEFLASMSHELRTPLNGVIGMTELLADSPLDDRQRRFVSACQSSGKALLELISDVLDFSKIEAGCMELEQHSFDLHELLDDIVLSMPPRLGGKNLELRHTVDDAVSTRVIGDSHRLRQVLVNLLSNAIKFTEQGEIVLRAECQSQSNRDTTILFSISDTGIGIPASRLDRLFQSFSQVDSSVNRKYGGSGLGLSICKAIVEKMDGEIGVDSREGVGSRFWFTANFRLCTAEVSSDANVDSVVPKPAMEKRTPGIRILLAEDNKINQLFTREMLSRLGWSCDVVENGIEALKALQQKPYDIVLMDCQMPIMDGFVATKRIRENEAKSGTDCSLVIVALTANAIQGDRERCLDAGMDDYLAKPFDPAQLKSTMEKCVAEVARRSVCEHAGK